MAISLLYKIRYFTKCRINAASSIILRGCKFEGENSIGKSAYLSHTVMGYGSYMGFSCEFSNSKIGRYCSIGNNVRIVSATHPDGLVSTHPSFYSKTFKPSYFTNSNVCEHIVTEDGWDCKVGNDVWIGDNVLIKGGVSIGNGSIIAMGSIVLHDVEPYTIVGGVPAKTIRKRFDDVEIQKIEEMKWWDKPFRWIKEHAKEFSDLHEFIRINCNDEKEESK